MAAEERMGPDVMYQSCLGSLLSVVLFASQPIPKRHSVTNPRASGATCTFRTVTWRACGDTSKNAGKLMTIGFVTL
jgi:hypothetical protein